MSVQDLASPLVADGPRPAVSWVTALPSPWLTSADRHLLLVLALDTFAQRAPFTASPSTAQLWAWTGDSSKGTLLARIGRLSQPVEGVRPALLEVKKGHGRQRTKYRLMTEHGPSHTVATPDDVRPLRSVGSDHYAPDEWSDLADHDTPDLPVDNSRSGPIQQTTDVRSDLADHNARSGPTSGPTSGPSDRTTPFPLPTTPATSTTSTQAAREARAAIAAARRAGDSR
ncbi:hypothetical protein [Nocardioides alkalitolerans]|uniref:hypothetical protein n=1 Tax=Nocardioides alkalitolerans TaxID=281714 RepID=UPI0004020E53|nr:hypothetical protein [Nocardioides alkalitolerans]